MSPSVNSKKKNLKEILKSKPNKSSHSKELKKEIEKNCEYVGENFEKEARAIHLGFSERSIYGKTTLKNNLYMKTVYL